jgi:hypothetical protein
MRSQYLAKVEEFQEEKRALLQSHGDRIFLKSRHASLSLLARRVLYVLHTNPIRRAFIKWTGHAHATTLQHLRKVNHRTNTTLSSRNDELGHALRREQAMNRSLEGRLASQASMRNYTRVLSSGVGSSGSSGSGGVRDSTMYGGINAGNDLRVFALVEELEKARRANQEANKEVERWRQSEKRAK